MSLEKEFVPYELAVKLKELGFNERCFAYYNDDIGIEMFHYFGNNYTYNYNSAFVNNECISAVPLWQQAFDFFREKHGLLGFVENGNIMNNIRFHAHINSIEKSEVGSNVVREVNLFDFVSYEQARQACIEKLIEIISCKSEN